MHSPKNQIYIYIYIYIQGYGTKPNNKNKKERMRPDCQHGGLELFKSTKVIDTFRNIKGINLACYWAF